MNTKQKEKQRALVHAALNARLDALDKVIANRCGETIRFSMLTAERLETAIEYYHEVLNNG